MLFIRLFSKLPFFLLYALSTFLYYVTYYVIGYRKKVVFDNLRNSFPEKSESEIESIAKGFYRNLMDVVLETVKLMTISREELVKRVYIENIEVINDFYMQGKSVVVLASHHSNWEWLTASATIQIKHAVDGIYLRLNNQFFDQLMKDMRSRFGANLIEKKDVFRSLITRKNIVRTIAIVGDQAPAHDANVLWTKFLNQTTNFFTGAERIATKLDIPVIYVEMRRIKRGYYCARFEVLTSAPTDADEYEITTRFVRATEKTIQNNPSGWLWSHKRWKYTYKKTNPINN